MRARRISSKLREPKFTVNQEVTHTRSGKNGVIIDGWWDCVENRYLISIRSHGIEKGIWSIAESSLKDKVTN